MPDDATIVIDKLTKQYPSSHDIALDALSIKVHKGEVYGFLGPNGAGKSTAIRLLLNFIQPTSGSARILGKDIVSESVQIRRNIGYLAGDFAVYPKMTGKQFFDYMGTLLPLKRRGRVDELCEMLRVDKYKKIGELSKGNKQKIGIIQALMHEPSILILDEPTDGLDPLMQEVFYAIVKEISNKGATVFVSSHNLAEVHKMCDRVGIIRNGKLVSQNTIADMEIKASQTIDVTFAAKAPIAELKKIPGAKLLHHKGETVSLQIRDDFSPLFQLLARHKVVRFDTQELNLEEEFMRFYETKEKR